MPDHADQIKLQNPNILPASESKVADSKPTNADILADSYEHNAYDELVQDYFDSEPDDDWRYSPTLSDFCQDDQDDPPTWSLDDYIDDDDY